jgi:DNA-binding NtrC family response regulator
VAMSGTAEESPLVRTILIVEDDVDVGEFLVQAIQQETPYQPILAHDGVQALRHVQSLKPDLFLFDYLLPEINGVELYNKMHQIEELKDIPVLFMTANFPFQKMKNRDFSFIKKPFELDELIQKLENLLSDKE